MKLFRSLSIISGVTLTFGLKCWFKINAHSSLNYTFGLSMSHIGQKEENIRYKTSKLDRYTSRRIDRQNDDPHSQKLKL